jgi:hypothetical protein
MLAPKFAALLAIVGSVLVIASAVLGETSFADWTLDAAQAFLSLGVIVFLGYFLFGCIIDIRNT